MADSTYKNVRVREILFHLARSALKLEAAALFINRTEMLIS